VEWLFDTMYSVSILEDLEIVPDGQLTALQQQIIKKEAFDHVANYNYFTKLIINGAAQKIASVSNFAVQYNDDQLLYSFLIPLDLPISQTPTDIIISQYDQTYFVAVYFDGTVHGTPPEAIQMQVTSHENFDDAFYFGQIAPIEAHIQLSASTP